MYCIKCGKPLKDSSQFCEYCGAKQPDSFCGQKNEKSMTDHEAENTGLEAFQLAAASQRSEAFQGAAASQEPEPKQFSGDSLKSSFQGAADFNEPGSYQDTETLEQTEFIEENSNYAQAQLLDTADGGSKKRSGMAKVIGVLAAVLVLALILVGGLIWWNQPAKRMERLIQAGQKYLAEADYDQSILTFEKAIAIDPKNAALYSDLAGAYIQKAKTASDDEKVRLYKLASNNYKEALYYDEDNSQLAADISDLYVEWSDFYIDQ